MRKMPRQVRGIGTLLAALLFLVQSFGAAYALGFRSHPGVLDAFGNSLCITSHQDHQPGRHERGGSLTDCCALACAGIAGTAALPGDTAGIVVPDARLLASLAGPFPAPCRVAAQRMAGDPRAPPHAIDAGGLPAHPSHRSAA